MSFPLGISDSQKKQPPLPPSVVSQSDSGSGRDFDNGANFLTFQGTTFTGKLPIIDYTVTATATDNSDTVSLTVNTVNPFVFTGLKSGKNYKFKIRARNQVYTSSDSSEFGPGLATTVPGRTTSTGATNLANSGGASLSWTAPANGGKTITSYLITPNIGTPVETNSSSTSYTFSGLTVGTGYNFTVAARNENGLGQASTVSNTITITAPTPPPAPPTPPPPAGSSNPAFNSFNTSYIGSYNAYVGTGIFSGNAFTASYSWISSDGQSGFGNGSGATISSGPVACNNQITFTVVLYSGLNQSGTSVVGSQSVVTPACPGGGGGGGTIYTGTWGPCSYSSTKENMTISTSCGGVGGCDLISTRTYAGVSTCTGGLCNPALQPVCPPLVASTNNGGYNTGCCPEPTPPPPPPASTTCNTLLYTYSEVRICCGAGVTRSISVYACTNGTTIERVAACPACPPPPAAPPPATPPPTPPPPSSSCPCRDFRGRCASARFCDGFI
jgi:hypothetical protein